MSILANLVAVDKEVGVVGLRGLRNNRDVGLEAVLGRTDANVRRDGGLGRRRAELNHVHRLKAFLTKVAAIELFGEVVAVVQQKRSTRQSKSIIIMAKQEANGNLLRMKTVCPMAKSSGPMVPCSSDSFSSSVMVGKSAVIMHQ